MGNEFVIGSVVRARAGRDNGRFFVVTSMEMPYVFICDGKRRLVDKPKKKKTRHLSVTGTLLSEDSLATNRQIRRALAPFNNNNDVTA